jgi:hypothetical protein
MRRAATRWAQPPIQALSSIPDFVCTEQEDFVSWMRPYFQKFRGSLSLCASTCSLRKQAISSLKMPPQASHETECVSIRIDAALYSVRFGTW